MGLEKSLMILNDEVFVRTQLGAQEVANVSGSALPREARTLLILIDGRKSYAQVTRLLENRKMFRSTGGLKRHLQMLIDLDYVKFSNPEMMASNDVFVEMGSEHSEITLFTKADKHHPSVAKVANNSTATGTLTPSKHRRNLPKTKDDCHALEQLRSIMLDLIAKHGEQSIVERYSSALNECKNMRCIFDAIQKLRAESSGQFEVALTMAARAFKNSKVT